MSRLFWVMAFYGALNAAAYSCLLPLWEGFDEGFHYGYVQLLSTSRSFPVLGKAFLSQEVWRSYESTPVSHYLQPYTRAPLDFAGYFAMSRPERENLHRQLVSIEAGRKYQPERDKPNYEVNQSPLPYVLMAALDYPLSSFPIPTRVLWIRLVCALLAVLSIAHSTLLVAREIALPELYAAGALFCVFSSQMLLAVICHICNDCFAVPLMGYLIWTAIRAARTGNPGEWLGMGVALTSALLIKAYFLFMLPIAACVLAWNLYRRQFRWKSTAWFAAPLALFAGPWYARNMSLYHSISGTVESTSGLGFGRFLKAALQLPWRESIRYMAHSSLWTGNNSFTTFSTATLDLLLALLGVGVFLYLLRARPDPAELLLAASIILFSCGVAFISVAFYSATSGAAISAVPWYQQVLLVPVLLIAFLGLHRRRRIGALVFAALALLWTYLLLATYWAKLIPLYGGFPEARARPRQLWEWYVHAAAERESILRTLCLAPPSVLWIRVIGASVVSVAICAILLARAQRCIAA